MKSTAGDRITIGNSLWRVWPLTADRAHHGANADYEKYVEDIGAQNIADGNLGFVLNGGCQRNYEVGRGELNATIVRPITRSDTLKRRAMAEAPSVR